MWFLNGRLNYIKRREQCQEYVKTAEKENHTYYQQKPLIYS